MVSSSFAAVHKSIIPSTIRSTKRYQKGRQKIEIKKIEKKDSRQVTFSKRPTGLFKKAAELCVLTGAKIAILVNSSDGGKVYMFDDNNLIDCYQNNVVETGQLGFPTNEFNECYDDVSREMIMSSSSNSEEDLVDGMDIGQLEEYVCSLEEMKKDVVTKADELKISGNIPAMLGSEEMKKNEVVEANDSVVINNSEAVLDLDLPLDMSWLDSDFLDMSWIDSYIDHFDMNTNDAFNLKFHHGVEV